jgi:preprotein translocase subunit SecG
MEMILFVLFVLVCILLVCVILLQKGRGGGLSGAFGGAGGHTAFGTRTGDMFTWVTVVLMGLFVIFASVAVKVYRPAAMGMPRAAAPAGAPAEVPATAPATGTAPAAEAPAESPVGELPGADAPTEAPATTAPAPK